MTEQNKFWRAVGYWSLFTLIGFGVATLAVFAYSGYWYWFWTIGACFASVITAEIISFIIKKKSISSQYGELIKKNPVMGYLGLLFFSLAMASLVAHLAAYGLR